MATTTGPTGDPSAPTGRAWEAGRRWLVALAIVGALASGSPAGTATGGDREAVRDRPIPMGISVPLPPPS